MRQIKLLSFGSMKLRAPIVFATHNQLNRTGRMTTSFRKLVGFLETSSITSVANNKPCAVAIVQEFAIFIIAINQM